MREKLSHRHPIETWIGLHEDSIQHQDRRSPPQTGKCRLYKSIVPQRQCFILRVGKKDTVQAECRDCRPHVLSNKDLHKDNAAYGTGRSWPRERRPPIELRYSSSWSSPLSNTAPIIARYWKIAGTNPWWTHPNVTESSDRALSGPAKKY